MPNPSDDLKALREQKATLREQRAAAKKRRDEARDAAKGAFAAAEDKAAFMGTQTYQDAEDAVAALGEIDDKLAQLAEVEAGMLRILGQEAETEGASNGNASLEAGKKGGRAFDARAMLRESGDYKAALEGGVFHSTGKFGTVELGEMASREEVVSFLRRQAAGPLPGAPAGTVDSTASYIAPDFRGIIPPRLMPLTLLDLIPVGTTDSNVINYVQVTAIPQAAAETAELGLKPEAGLTTQDETAPVRTIPSWIKLSRQSLSDIAMLASMIDQLLPYDVRRRLLAQILAGDGTGQNLLGLYNVTGVAAPAAVANDNVADAILRAITTIVLSDSDPNFVTLNPTTWQNLRLMRAGAQDGSWAGQYLYGGPGEVQAPTIWGLAVTSSRVVPQAHPLVGDATGAMLFIREGLNTRTSDSDQDDFVRNRVTVLAELRAAFAVLRPSAFAIVAQG